MKTKLIKISFFLFFLFFQNSFICADTKDQIVKIAADCPVNSGYDVSLKSGGVPEDIYFKGVKILSSNGKTYCSGFTFFVAFSFLKNINALDKLGQSDIKKFQRDWYGVTKKTAEKQCVDALINIDKGVEINAIADLQKGDFLQFWRNNKTGHSAIFIDFLYGQGHEIVGIKYISSQKSTDGIAEKTEYFYDETSGAGSILKDRFYAVRISG